MAEEEDEDKDASGDTWDWDGDKESGAEEDGAEDNSIVVGVFDEAKDDSVGVTSIVRPKETPSTITVMMLDAADDDGIRKRFLLW